MYGRRPPLACHHPRQEPNEATLHDEVSSWSLEGIHFGVNPTNCTKCVRVFRQDHHPGKGERIMS